jgi:hypothetical protein
VFDDELSQFAGTTNGRNLRHADRRNDRLTSTPAGRFAQLPDIRQRFGERASSTDFVL